MYVCDIYTLCYVFEGKTCDIITFTQFEEGNILTKNLNDAESGDESYDNSFILALLREEEMDDVDSGDESDDDLISTKMLEYIRDRSQSLPNINTIESHYKVRDRINKRQSEWKGALKFT